MDQSHGILGVAENATREEIHKAYRELAQRWHPDRFMEGPERLWAEQKMIEINRAYNECISRCSPEVSAPKDGRYGDVRQLIEVGQLSRARVLLLKMEGRDAEWNFYFGRVLFERREYDKAALFLKIALRQSPENQTYAVALANAEAMRPKKTDALARRIRSILKKKAI